MKDNTNLYRAKQKKNDEFYTRYEDIENEMCHYDFSGKSVYCPCDDFRWSNFTNYFVQNFTELGLKKFVCTNYDIGDGAYMYEYDGIDGTLTELEGDGDYNSAECTAIRDESDIIVTNPPFSKYKDFFQWVSASTYCVVCNKNALAWKTIFPVYLEGKTGFGYNKLSYFILPDDVEDYYKIDENGYKINHFEGTGRWMTNLPVEKHNPPIKLVELDNSFRKFDTYNAWNTNSIKKIPDTDELIGTPIGILDIINEEQFEVVGELCRGSDTFDPAKPIMDGKCLYTRILIKRK